MVSVSQYLCFHSSLPLGGGARLPPSPQEIEPRGPWLDLRFGK